MKSKTFVCAAPHPQSVTGRLEFSSCNAPPGKQTTIPPFDSPRPEDDLCLPSDCFLPDCDSIEETKYDSSRERHILKPRLKRYASDSFPQCMSQTKVVALPHLMESNKSEDGVPSPAIQV
eukprot:scaffold2490_cov169-Amphora_coffeaeformis.AAC.15